MHRFFVSAEALREDPVELPEAVAHQLSRVLRAQPGDEIILLDGTGRAAQARLQHVAARSATARVVCLLDLDTEPRSEVILYAALPKGRRFEDVLQKGAEVGVSRFVPTITARCVVSDAASVGEERLTRWRRILIEAAELSGRTRIPEVEAVQPFAQVCVAPPEGVLGVIPWEEERATSLRSALERWREESAQPMAPAQVRVYIGPEGGFTPDEIALAREQGIQAVTLGPRILRADTAAIVAPALILYELGDMGRGLA
jgi:16S rRNA (uracil1498-N3)-methyltransferase